MKKSELRKLIREEIQLLNEGQHDFDNDVEALIRKHKFERKSRREFLKAVEKATQFIHIW